MSDAGAYQANYEDDFSKIKDENSAFAYLLGLSSGPFNKYCSIFAKAQENHKVISEADRPFMSDYSDYLKRHFALGMPARDYVHSVYSSARALQKWDGYFEQYASALHDEGFIFQNKTYEALTAKGIRLEYSDTGWAVSFYKRWLQEDLWTLEEAKCLFKGEDPKDGRNYHDLSQNRFSISLGFIWGPYDSEHVDLQDRIDRSIAAQTLPAQKINDTWYFRPGDITAWFAKHTSHIPPKALLEVLGINETPAGLRKQTCGAETNCRTWLTDLMQNGSDPQKPKTDYEREAKNTYGVGSRAFGRAWRNAIEATRNDLWAKPGRKKNHNTRIDTPIYRDSYLKEA